MRGGVLRRDVHIDGAGAEPCPAVDAVAARDRGDHGQLQRPDRIVHRHPLSGRCEDPVRIRRRADIDRDTAAEPVDVSQQNRVRRPLTGRRQQPGRTGGLARGPRIPGGGELATGGGERVGGQVCGAFVCVGGGAVAAASLGPRADPVEGGDQVLVRPVGGGGAVPGGPVGVFEAVQGIGQRAMDLAPLVRGRGLVHRGPNERMPNRHSVTADHQEPGPFRLRDRVRGHAKGGSGSLHGR